MPKRITVENLEIAVKGGVFYINGHEIPCVESYELKNEGSKSKLVITMDLSIKELAIETVEKSVSRWE